MAHYLTALYGLYAPQRAHSGQGLVEYALILILISVVAVALMMTLGDRIQFVFQDASDKLDGVAEGN